MIFLLYLLLGAAAGLLSGLFGIGGGIIIVPVLVYSFSLINFPEAIIMQMALGTSLATIIVTSYSAAKAHHKRKNLLWPVLHKLIPGLLLGSLLGGIAAHYLSPSILKMAFAVFIFFIALRMWFELKPKPSGSLPKNAILFALTSVIGTVSALFGIGGGSLVVPLLTWCQLPPRQCIGTASATGVAVAITGSFGFLATGFQVEGLPQWSLGYIYLPAFFGIVISSTLFVRFGASLASHLSPLLLKRGFAVLLFVVAINMISL